MTSFTGVRVFSLLTALAALGGCATSTNNPQTDLDEYGDVDIRHYYNQPAELQVFALSPDGRRLAELNREDKALNILVTDLETGEKFTTTSFKDGGATGLGWAGPKRLVLFTGFDLEVLSIDYDGDAPIVLSTPSFHCFENCNSSFRARYVMNYTQAIHALPDDPKHILVAENGWGTDAFNSHIFRMNVETGHLELVQVGPDTPVIDRWFTDAAGNIIGAEQETGSERVILMIEPGSGEWNPVLRGPRSGFSFTPYFVSDNDGQGFAVTNVDATGIRQPNTALYRFDFNTHEIGEKVLHQPGGDCCELFVAPATGKLISATYMNNSRSHTVYLDESFARYAEKTGENVPGGDLRFISVDLDESRGIALLHPGSGDRRYYLADLETGELELLKHSPGVVELAEDYRNATGDIVYASGGRGPNGAAGMPTTRMGGGSAYRNPGNAAARRGAVRSITK
jgi:hypothetical protein